MKKWIVYILSLTALVVSLCACGTAEKPAATNAPRPSSTPMTATPDMNDGIITDDDTGVVPTQTPMADTSAKPSASAQATDGAAKK